MNAFVRIVYSINSSFQTNSVENTTFLCSTEDDEATDKEEEMVSPDLKDV